jgi:hypothetical protein
MINIEFTPEKDGIVAGEENTFEVLLRYTRQTGNSFHLRAPLESFHRVQSKL